MTHAHGGLRFRWHRRIRFMTKKAGLLAPAALHKKSWAVIDRPYSLGCATVGALYERLRCIFCKAGSGGPARWAPFLTGPNS